MPTSERIATVQQFPLFARMSPADCACIISSAQEKYFSRREKLFSADQAVCDIFLLISGRVKVMQFGQRGTAVILRISGPGELLGGWGSFLSDNHRETAQAVQLSKALVWKRETFESIWDRFPILWGNAERILNERLKDLEERFREVSTNKVRFRLSSELVRLLNQADCATNSDIEIRLSRGELAELTGMTVFTVSRLISEWEQQGILAAKRGTLLIHDLAALKALCRQLN